MKATLLASLVLCLTGFASPARAQGAYVGVALTGDLLRLDDVKSTGVTNSRGGEAIGFALRLGTELGTKWGVELEYARPAEIETNLSPGVFPAALERVVSSVSLPNSPLPGTSLIFPTYAYRIRTQERNTTLSAALWVRQELSPRTSIVYMGGPAFRRSSSEVTIGFEPSPLAGIPTIPIIFPPTVTTSISYDVGPFAGIEGRIGLTDHAQLVPGVRLLGVSGGWLVRPSVGIGWRF